MPKYHTSPQQIEAVRHLFEGVLDLVRASPCGVGRGRESFLEALKRLSSEDDVGVAQDLQPAALPVISERVAMPVKAGGCDPLAYLAPCARAELRDLEAMLLPEEKWPSPLPRQCHMISDIEESRLRRKLLKAGMACLIAEEDVPRSASCRKLLAGLFCVKHKLETDRLSFLQMPPKNATGRRLGWCTLPHGLQFTDLVLEPTETLRGSGDDLSNYFYQLSRAEPWWRRSSFS